MKSLKTLVVVDMQKDFIDGVLGTPEAQAIEPKVAEFIKGWNGKVVFTMDTHHRVKPEDNPNLQRYCDLVEGQKVPIHCEKYTPGWCFGDAIMDALNDVCERTEYSIIYKRTFMDRSIASDVCTMHNCGFGADTPQEIVIVGLCTDICVISNALYLRSVFPDIPIKVMANLCAGTTPKNHEAALKVMKACCIEIVED